ALADRGDAIVMVEHRVEEAMRLRPDFVLYLEDGRQRYIGSMDGFLGIADPGAVKLPFEVVLARVRADAEQSGLPAPVPEAEVPPAPGKPSGEEGPPRLEFRAVRASIGDHEVLRGVDAKL